LRKSLQTRAFLIQPFFKWGKGKLIRAEGKKGENKEFKPVRVKFLQEKDRGSVLLGKGN